jgi:transposase
MAKAYSADMRKRVIGQVESGASRREAAEHYEVSPSTAVIWVKCFRETGRCAAKPRGGSTSPLEKHADFLLALIEVEPDLTLDEVVSTMRKQKIPGSRTAVWRFFQRHKITFKKKACAQRSRSVRTWRGHADAGCANRAYSIRPGWCSSMVCYRDEPKGEKNDLEVAS